MAKFVDLYSIFLTYIHYFQHSTTPQTSVVYIVSVDAYIYNNIFFIFFRMPKLPKRRLEEQYSAPQDDDESSLSSSSADSYVDILEVEDNERPTPTSAAELARHPRQVQKNRGIDDDDDDEDIDVDIDDEDDEDDVDDDDDELEKIDHRNYRNMSGNVKKDTADRDKKKGHHNNLEKKRRKGMNASYKKLKEKIGLEPSAGRNETVEKAIEACSEKIAIYVKHGGNREDLFAENIDKDLESSDEQLDEDQKEEAVELIRQLAKLAEAQGVEVPDHIRSETERVTGVKSSTHDSFEDGLLSGYGSSSYMSQSPTQSASTSSRFHSVSAKSSKSVLVVKKSNPLVASSSSRVKSARQT